MGANPRDVLREVVGNSGASLGLPFNLAIARVTQWPPDAFSLSVEDNKVRTIYWVRGDAIGVLNAEGNNDDPDITGELRSIGEVRGVSLACKVIDDQFGAGEVRRGITIRFTSGPDVEIDVATGEHQHLRDRADEFIDAVLGAMQGDFLDDLEDQ